MIEYTVQEGDCLVSIAQAHGFFWETLWNLPENDELRERQEEPMILLPGDIVWIPDLQLKQESGSTGQRHRFRRKGTPAMLRLRIMRLVEPEEEEQPEEPADQESSMDVPPEDEPLEVTVEDPPPPEELEEEPWANAPYLLEIDGTTTDGQTDSEGKLEVFIPPTAQRGRLTMEPGTERETVYVLRLGYLDPITSASGIADRLSNLGYFDGTRPNEMTPELQETLRKFQETNDLEVTGEVDQATQDKLRELHGS